MAYNGPNHSKLTSKKSVFRRIPDFEGSPLNSNGKNSLVSWRNCILYLIAENQSVNSDEEKLQVMVSKPIVLSHGNEIVTSRATVTPSLTLKPLQEAPVPNLNQDLDIYVTFAISPSDFTVNLQTGSE